MDDDDEARVSGMAQEFAQDVRDAIALTTLLADAVESGANWNGAQTFARDRLVELGERLAMAQAHLLLQSLGTLRDVLNGLPEDCNIDGLSRPVGIADLLGKIAADAAGYEG